ncbi:DUF6292 family protein [Rhodococcus tibetensis]|uniref:DUF6292 family protein n=1 Tax=Rhodococcus tibetensis TaxID=2965064 RepID=A0ABT1QBH7_9NOCA|nr:DUF6292 family protein [Rhodococcus sp. FXJ9.536]MCQ4118450.1 DUF6292 family protein [Rhodococcus sp. FXJ9.536]
MKSGTGVADQRTVQDYIHAVARCVHADSIDWWASESIDVVLVLPLRLRYLPGRNAVLVWNRHFGWSLGVEGVGRASVVVIDGLGIGRTPPPAVCSDRALELIDGYWRSTPVQSGSDASDISAAQGESLVVRDRCPRIGAETRGRRDRVVKRP